MRLGLLCLVASCAWMAVGNAAIATPRPKSVRIVYLVSADRSVREDFRKGIKAAAKDLQGWYGRQLGGPTFRLNEPVVEVARSDKEAKWFYSHPNGGNQDDWGYNNGLAEAQRLVGAKAGDPQYVWVIYSDGPGNKGRGGGGVAVLPEDDLLGLVGQHPTQKEVKRWIAGLGHELGHAFGLAHPRDTEKYADAIMWTGIYGKYPDKTYLTDEDKTILMKSPFFFRPDGARSSRRRKPWRSTPTTAAPSPSISPTARLNGSSRRRTAVRSSALRRPVVTRTGSAFSTRVGTWRCVCPWAAAGVPGPRTTAKPGTPCTRWTKRNEVGWREATSPDTASAAAASSSAAPAEASHATPPRACSLAACHESGCGVGLPPNSTSTRSWLLLTRRSCWVRGLRKSLPMIILPVSEKHMERQLAGIGCSF